MITLILAKRKDAALIKDFRDKASKESQYNAIFNNLSLTNLKALLIDLTSEQCGRMYCAAIKTDAETAVTSMVGQLVLSINTSDQTLHIDNIAVLREEYGSGLSKLLMDFAYKEASNIQPITLIQLIVDNANKRAVRFFEKQGFKYLKETKKGSSNHIYVKPV